MVDLRPRAHGLRTAELAANRAARRNEIPNQPNEGGNERANEVNNHDHERPQDIPNNQGQGQRPQDILGQELAQPPVRGGRAPGRAGIRGRAQGRAQGRVAGHGAQEPPPFIPPPPALDEYVLMLQRMGFTQQAIAQLQNLGLTSLEDYCDISEKDVPAIMKELRRGNVLVRQTSQNYLQALRYWVVRKERLQVNYLPQQFTDEVMRTSLQRYQCSLEPPSHDMIKAPEKFKEKMK